MILQSLTQTVEDKSFSYKKFKAHNIGNGRFGEPGIHIVDRLVIEFDFVIRDLEHMTRLSIVLFAGSAAMSYLGKRSEIMSRWRPDRVAIPDNEKSAPSTE